MKKLLTTLPLLLLASTLTACGTTNAETPPPAESTEIPPTEALPPTATPIPTPACNPLVYNEPQKIGTSTGGGNGIYFVESADVTGDGYTDVILSRLDFQTTNLFEIEIWRNDGEGGFVLASPDVYEGAVPTTQHPREFVFADFNGDGVTDFFVADHGQDADPYPGYQNTLALSAPGGKLVDATTNLPQQYDYSH
ncbi:MAG: VCBS repeat-containing protein, partial [Anaerolineales bacterium]|nr:VCBS repeat-containing protein [Anaerolineales bacterium]